MKAITTIHRQFCELLPLELLKLTNPTTGAEVLVEPGEIRKQDVEVGRHIAVSPGAVERFLIRFNEAYSSRGRIESILAVSCAHHCLLWVHPFLDGIGRVARLQSHAMLNTALNSSGLWSVSRGLARNEADYSPHLMACDGPRRGDRDGPGNLSESALAEFAKFCLRV